MFEHREITLCSPQHKKPSTSSKRVHIGYYLCLHLLNCLQWLYWLSRTLQPRDWRRYLAFAEIALVLYSIKVLMQGRKQFDGGAQLDTAPIQLFKQGGPFWQRILGLPRDVEGQHSVQDAFARVYGEDNRQMKRLRYAQSMASAPCLLCY